MIVDSATLLILGIVFTTLSLTERTISILKEKKILEKIQRKITKKKNLIEESIKSNKSILENQSITSLIDDIKEDLNTNIIDEIHNELGLVSIS